MDAANSTETQVDGAKASRPNSLVHHARHRLRNFGAAIASIAAVGAIIGGLTGYWNAWKAVRTDLLGDKVAGSAPATTVSEGPTVAVAPFSSETDDASQQALANGLTQETIAALTKFRSLRVLARSVAGNKSVGDETNDLRRRLGADYVVEGDLRKGADATRVSIRLVNAVTGDRVWARTFDAKRGADDYLSAQDEIAGRAAAFLGSWIGPIASDQYPRIASKPLAALSPYECMVQAMAIARSPMPESLVRGRGCLEPLVAKEPANAQAWAILAYVYWTQRFSGAGLPAEEAANIEKRAYLIDKAFAAATKAVALAPNDSFVHRQLALTFAVRCDREMLLAEGRKAIALNPNDPTNYGSLGVWIALLGDFDTGAAMAEKAIAMTAPETPANYWIAIATRDFAHGDYRQAYDAGTKYHVDQDWSLRLGRAAGHEANGRHSEAQAEIAAILKMRPGLTIREVDARQRALCIDATFNEKWEGFLRKAGLPE
jgi:TolB-like protein/tetratricopeptide (TPR) repeat protein